MQTETPTSDYNQLSSQLSSIEVQDIENENHDILILSYMAAIMQQTRAGIASSETAALPYIAEAEPASRTHRVIIYNQPVASQQLAFVGFMSKRRPTTPQTIMDQISSVDKVMIAELTSVEGLQSYSSLELFSGIWCNLVTFSHATIKEHIRARPTHQHAAYELAPRYYEWIRLHHGRFEHLSNSLYLHQTKYYTFYPSSTQPDIQSQIYIRQPASREEIR